MKIKEMIQRAVPSVCGIVAAASMAFAEDPADPWLTFDLGTTGVTLAGYTGLLTSILAFVGVGFAVRVLIKKLSYAGK